MIKKYTDFKTIHIFDFDDTLVKTPSFEENVYQYLKENITAKELLDNSLNKINKEINDLNYENGRIYIDDPNNTIILKGNWSRKKARVYLTSPDLYSYIDESMPKELKEISKIYQSVENKCILTARPEPTRNKIENILNDLNLDYPKFGLYMRPPERMNAGQWKGEKIYEIARKGDFNNVIFYDDNPKYIKNVKKYLLKRNYFFDIKYNRVY